MTYASRQPAPVVKLGGSLFGSPNFDRLVVVAASHGAVVVAGGGPFADAVRTAQAMLSFDDATAHRMALLAMEQAAHFIASRAPNLRPCATRNDFDAAAAVGQSAVWLPAEMAIAADVPASWDVTSDSLALWLTRRIGARRLVLVKSATIPPSSGLPDWSAEGLVDPHLAALAAGFDGELSCVGEGSPAALEAALAAPLRVAA